MSLVLPEKKETRAYRFHSRKKAEVKPQVRKEAKLWSRVEDISVCDCETSCLHSKLGKHLQHVLQHHNESAILSSPAQKKKTLTYLSQHTKLTTKRVVWTILGETVCQKAWGAYHGLADSTLSRYRKEYKDGTNPDSSHHGNEGKNYRSPQRYVSLDERKRSPLISY
jgi:hypothetical protein